MHVVSCPRCRTPLPAESIPAGGTDCAGCNSMLRFEIFPALARPVTTGSISEAAVEGESECFYHSGRRSVAVCDACGRFLCAVCDLDLGDAHYCPACLEAGTRKQRIQSLELERKRYDILAVYLAVLPMLLCWFGTVVSAPAALFLAIRSWRAPPSLVARTRPRLVAAGALAAVQIGVWGFILVYWLF